VNDKPEDKKMRDYTYRPPITQAELKHMFYLFENEGVFKRNTNVNGRTSFSGKSPSDHDHRGNMHEMVYGTMTGDGTLRMMVKGRSYLVHHLVWLYMYGELPTCKVGHIDGDKTNNAII